MEIYSPPECACCHDRGFRRLPDGTIVCSRCEPNILYVNRATNQEYSRCIEALQETALSDSGDQNVAKAIDYLYLGKSRENPTS